MLKRWGLLALVLTLGMDVGSAWGAGRALVVGGGGMSADLLDRFVEITGGAGQRICIFGTNSSDPDDSMAFYVEAFGERGAIPVPVPVTMKNSAWNVVPFDDGGRTFRRPEEEVRVTPERLTEDATLAAEVAACDGVWFGGGNQSRGTFALLNEDGSDTPVAAAIREVWSRGGSFGGTSAGAALQSRNMIVAGRSYDSLHPDGGADRVVVGAGLGILPEGILVDQHFLARGRYGRLRVAMAETGSTVGMGVDEKGAVIFDGATQRWRVEGPIQVLVVVAERPELGAETRVHLLGDGDVFHGDTGEVVPSASLTDITDDPYNPPEAIFTADIFNDNRVPEIVTRLVDTEGQNRATGLAFQASSAPTFGTYAVRLTFERTPHTQAFYCLRTCRAEVPKRSVGTHRYTVSNLRVTTGTSALVVSEVEERVERPGGLLKLYRRLRHAVRRLVFGF